MHESNSSNAADFQRENGDLSTATPLQILTEDERFSAVFQANPMAVSIATVADGRFVDANDSCLRMFGFPREEVIGYTAMELGVYANPAERQPLMGALQNGETVRGREMHMRNRSGADLYLLVFMELIELHGEQCVMTMCYDIAPEKRSQEELRRAAALLSESLNQVRALAARLMNVQDEERRRIARELHETTAQDLAALKMNLAALERSGTFQNEKDRALLTESTQLAEQAMKDVRTLSYLLHPPFLDEVGLVPALRWYAMGFAQRSGIGVELALPEDFERLPQELETTLFRIVQESLTNIHRHAASPRAAIRLRRSGAALELEVQDWGRGIPPASDNHKPLPHVFGVGIAGMRERLEQLGGELEVEFGSGGTTVKAWLSLPELR